MPVSAPSSPTGLARPFWLVAAVAAITLVTVALAVRAIALDRTAHQRYEEAVALARQALEAQHAGAVLQAALLQQALDATLRGGPDASGSDLTERELLAETLVRSLQRFDTRPLSVSERLQLAMISESVRSRRPRDPHPLTSDTLDQSLAEFISGTSERMLALARSAEADRLSARDQLMVCSAVSLLLACGLLALAFRTQFASRKLLGQLAQMTQEDPLTGIMNRRGLDAALTVELARAKRSREPLTLVMIDLDFFKKFNDRRGHAAGDALLRGAAQAWARQLRPTDLIARYGGEEFTLVLASCDADQAALLVSRLRPLVPERQTFSAGIATWDEDEGGSELLQRADLALAQAKKTGRNRSMIAGREPQATLPLQIVS